jgi:hypothetical protein
VAHYERVLVVVVGLLVQGSDRRHLSALLWDFDAVSQADQITVESARDEQFEDEPNPKASQSVQAQSA